MNFGSLIFLLTSFWYQNFLPNQFLGLYFFFMNFWLQNFLSKSRFSRIFLCEFRAINFPKNFSVAQSRYSCYLLCDKSKPLDDILDAQIQCCNIHCSDKKKKKKKKLIPFSFSFLVNVDVFLVTHSLKKNRRN